MRTLGNASINKTLHTLAMVLDDAEDAGWIDRNPARGRRVREPAERRHSGGALEVDELLDILEAADDLERTRHNSTTLERAALVRLLRDESHMSWKGIGQRLEVAPTTAIYLYGCYPSSGKPAYGVRRAIIATLGLAGPRVTELCQLDNQDIDFDKARFHIRDSKTHAGVRAVDIHPRLLDELAHYGSRRGPLAMDAPAFPTRTGARRDKDNVRSRMISPAVARANKLRAQRGQAPIRTHVTPHTFRRTYITFLIAAGYDLPYVQAQVGHSNPALTLSIYAQLMRRADRDELRAEIRELLESPSTPLVEGKAAPAIRRATAAAMGSLRAAETAAKGRRLGP